LDWINEQISKGRYSFITQAIENMIYQIKKWDSYKIDGHWNPWISIPPSEDRTQISINPRRDIFKILDEWVLEGRAENKSEAIDKMVEAIKRWDSFEFQNLKNEVDRWY
jgi:hypothetical protein